MTPGDRAVRLLDDSGREHEAVMGADGTIAVDGLRVNARDGGDGLVRLAHESVSMRAWVVDSAGAIWVFLEGAVFTFRTAQGSGRRQRSALHEGALTAPMPATVRQVNVSPGDVVRQSDVLVVLEAMKMELPVKAAADGRVAAINCRPGDLVQAGQELVQVEPE